MNRKTIAAALAFTGLAGLISTTALADNDWGRQGDYRQECQRMWPGGQNGPRGMRGDDNGPRGQMRCDHDGPRGMRGDNNGPRGQMRNGDGPRGQMRNAAFDRADADNDGSVTFDEFQALMGGRLASADANGDGVVTPAELVDQLQKRREERAAAILKRFDANDDGTVTRGPQVANFAQTHGLKQVSVADLIAYRQRKETLVERLDSFEIETPGGKARAHTYNLPWESMQHLAIVFGDIRDGEDVPVRLHTEDVVADVFGTSQRLREVMMQMGKDQRGVIVYLREGSVGVGRPGRNRPAQGEDHDEARQRENEWREIGLGAQILKDLGISSINLISSRERHYVGLEGFGIRISRTEIR